MIPTRNMNPHNVTWDERYSGAREAGESLSKTGICPSLPPYPYAWNALPQATSSHRYDTRCQSREPLVCYRKRDKRAKNDCGVSCCMQHATSIEPIEL